MRISDWSSDVCSSDLTSFGATCEQRPVWNDDQEDVTVGAGPVSAEQADQRLRTAVDDAEPVAAQRFLDLRGQLLRALRVEAGVDAFTAEGSLPLLDVGEAVGDPVGVVGEGADRRGGRRAGVRSEEHTSELQSLMRISYAVFCLKK